MIIFGWADTATIPVQPQALPVVRHFKATSYLWTKQVRQGLYIIS